MPAAEPPTATPTLALAEAFTRIAELRAEGYDLVYPQQFELARLRKGAELVIVPAVKELRHVRH